MNARPETGARRRALLSTATVNIATFRTPELPALRVNVTNVLNLIDTVGDRLVVAWTNLI